MDILEILRITFAMRRTVIEVGALERMAAEAKITTDALPTAEQKIDFLCGLVELYEAEMFERALRRQGEYPR